MKTRKERRAEAVERLRELRDGKRDCSPSELLQAMVAWSGNVYDQLIDLLSEDECGARVTNVCENLHDPDLDEQNSRSEDGDSGSHVTSDPEKVTFDDAPRLSDLYGIWREDKRADEQELSQDDLATIYRLGLGNVDSVQFVDESDTREKLEEDVYDFFHGDTNFLQSAVALGWLDRQAAITKRETREAVEFAKRIESAARERRPLDVFGVSYVPKASFDADSQRRLEDDIKDACKCAKDLRLAWQERYIEERGIELDKSTLMATYSGHVMYTIMCDFVRRQAEITRRECADELDNMCDSRERIYDRVCDNLTAKIFDRDTEIEHMRNATGEMVKDLWHAYELMRAHANYWLRQAHKTGDALRDLRAVRDACADMVEELWRGLVMWRDRSEDMRMELADAESFAERVEGCVTKGEPVTLFGVDYIPERKPIVGKDGTLIARGDVVYGEDGVRFEVDGLLKDKKHCVMGMLPNGCCKALRPEWLTHECPDTVDMVRHDLLMGPHNYCKRHGLMPKTEDHMTFDVERAKGLMLAHIADRVREMGRR